MVGASRGSELVVLGVVTRPHGVRGEVRVHRFNPDSTLLLELPRVMVRRDGATRDLAIRASKRSGDADVLLLEGCTRPEEAEALRGAELVIPRDRLPPAGEGELYHADLIGLRVTEAGNDLGEVLEVASYPSVDALRVRTERGVLEIPLIEPYLVAVDLEAGTVEIAHSEDFEPEK